MAEFVLTSRNQSKEGIGMSPEQAKQQALELVDRLRYAVMGTFDERGAGSLRAMTKIENEGLTFVWFATSEGSRKVRQLRQNPRTTLYFSDSRGKLGVTLFGRAEVLQDPLLKQRVWRPGFRTFWAQGSDDPDYCVLRFAAERGIYSENRTGHEFVV